MSRQSQPATQWHQFVELAQNRVFGFYDKDDVRLMSAAATEVYIEYGEFMNVIRKADKSPKMVITDELIEAMPTDVMADSMMAMIEAEVLHLPYPKMVIEGNYLNWADERVFFYCEEGTFIEPINGKPTTFEFKGQMWTVYREDPHRIVIHPFTVFMSFTKDRKFLIACPPAAWLQAKAKEDLPELIAQAAEIESKAAIRLLAVAFVVTNIKGVVRDVIEVKPGLNKARERKGRPPIPKHAVLRIGHVYDKSGNKHAYTQSGKLDGRSTKVYLRRGHTRKQRYGKEWSQERLIYIEPILVNYKGGDMPAPTTVLKW